MAKNYLLVSLEDEKSKNLAEVMQSRSCKKILELLSTEELTESDISIKLKMPLNTVGYNIKKLVSAGLIEKAKIHFWSVKGKKIPVYKLSNKYIIISPKDRSFGRIKSTIATLVFSGLGAGLIYVYEKSQFPIEKILQAATDSYVSTQTAANSVSSPVTSATNVLSSSFSSFSLWFLGGALFALIVFLILNWRKL